MASTSAILTSTSAVPAAMSEAFTHSPASGQLSTHSIAPATSMDHDSTPPMTHSASATSAGHTMCHSMPGARRLLSARTKAVRTSRIAAPSARQARHQALHATHQLLQAAPGELLHHLLRLLELLEQAVDLLHRHAGTGRDAALAAGLQDLGLRALLGRHRVDDALDAADGLLLGPA